MTSALLVCHYQRPIVDAFRDTALKLVETINTLTDVARSTGNIVIFVNFKLRTDEKDVSPDNQNLRTVRTMGISFDGDNALTHPAVNVTSDDIVTTNSRSSAFVGSDVEVILRAQGVRHIAIAGIATGGVVLSTVRAAADMDYVITVISDACYDPNAIIHQTLLEQVFPVQAQVLTSEEYIHNSKSYTHK